MKRNHILVIVIFAIVVVAIVAGAILMQKSTAVTDQEKNPWYWYNNAVDLANAGQYQQALDANQKALAINESFPLALANKAGILNQLGRYEEAISSADKAINLNYNTPVATASAYFNKGNALRALGRTAEAKTAYAQATALDPTLTNPYQT